jgi:hypothetical protein
LLEALVYVARFHGKQVSRESLTAGLPLHENRMVPSLVERAAERAGLETRIVECNPEALGAEALPAILLLREDQACVLLGRDDGHLRVVEAGGTETRITAQALEERYLGNAILARVAYGFDERAPELGGSAQRHWFWGAVLEHRALYRDVLLAAAMVSLFALALPLFSMNVYDRVVPNNAIETLWALSVGVLIVVCADFGLRTLRGYFVDLAGARADVKLSALIMEKVLGLRMEVRPDVRRLLRLQPARLRVGARLHQLGHRHRLHRRALRAALPHRHRLDRVADGDPLRGRHRAAAAVLADRAAQDACARRDHLPRQRAAQRDPGRRADRHRDGEGARRGVGHPGQVGEAAPRWWRASAPGCGCWPRPRRTARCGCSRW